MPETLSFTSTYILVTCVHAGCGIHWGVPDGWTRERRRDHVIFWCPNGHQQYYPSESDVERAERIAKSERERADRKQAWAERELSAKEAEIRSGSALRGHLTRTRRRVAAGVCPCCKRTPENLQRHMAGQHPTYGKRGDDEHRTE